MDHTLTRRGAIDALVNTAGIVHIGDPLDFDIDRWREVFNVNVEAMFFLTQAVLRTMVERGGGNVVNVSSIGAKIGNPAMIAYNASKAAVISVTRNLGTAYAGSGVRVNAVVPGVIDTDMWAAVDVRSGPSSATGVASSPNVESLRYPWPERAGPMRWPTSSHSCSPIGPGT